MGATIEVISRSDYELISTRLCVVKTLLDDLIECFLHRPDGVAHIEIVVKWLGRHTKRDLTETPTETVTRRLNDYTINANDRGNNGPRGRYCLFERIERATWKLLTYPERPNLFDIQRSKIGHKGFEEGLKLVHEQHPETKEMPRTRQFKILLDNYDTNSDFREYIDKQQSLWEGMATIKVPIE
jgi:hypothetical protein